VREIVGLRERWPKLRLDTVAERITQRNDDGLERVVTVSAEFGLVDQERFFTKRVASKDLSGYWVVEPGDFVYNKSWISPAFDDA